MRLEGKVALISGAASGIGAATALAMVRAGARVLLVDINAEAGAALAEQLGSAAAFASCDHTKPADCIAAVQVALKNWQRLDILYNNAGIALTAPFAEIDPVRQEQLLAVDLAGPMHLTRAALPHLREAGRREPAGAVLLFTASGLGLYGRSGMAVYSAAKHGVIGLTRSLAQELGPDNIRVNAICPALTDTPLGQAAAKASGDAQAVWQRVREATPLRRIVQPEDVAAAAVFLSSSEARMISGQALLIDGGVNSH